MTWTMHEGEEEAPSIPKPSSRPQAILAENEHPHCIVCGRKNPHGFHLKFSLLDDGSVLCVFDCRRILEGYPRKIHGGVIASLLDGAMTHCLFFHGYSALTAELNVRYHHSVETDKTAAIRGWIERASPRLYFLKSEIVQGGKVRATASAKFMNQPKSSGRTR